MDNQFKYIFEQVQIISSQLAKQTQMLDKLMKQASRGGSTGSFELTGDEEEGVVEFRDKKVVDELAGEPETQTESTGTVF